MENNDIINSEGNSTTMVDILRQLASQWDSVISEMNKLKSVKDIPELQSIVYSKRQDICDSILEIDMKIAETTRIYKASVKERAVQYMSGNMRYTEKEAEKKAQNDMYEIVYKINMFESYRNHLSNTLKTVDDIIYGIAQRIKVEELITGMFK